MRKIRIKSFNIFERRKLGLTKYDEDDFIVVKHLKSRYGR